ncbi:M56 family metallopeptidase [Flavobacterium denitrificans]|uniref:M56 family metallopeptidase n=1 Tax=Flavobacterium denitrificans TaxID=281361 RepID=UPI0003F64B46|nr:M56 family metallopeptidase [Flavobacterium denitrificans]
MEALFIYIAKSTGLIVMFFCVYHFLLRKETFFNTNRWFLLAGLGTSALLPLLVYTKTILVNPTPVSNFVLPQVPLSQTTPKEVFVINWNYILLAIYGLGFLILLIKFALDFYSLQSVLKGKKVHQQADFKFIDTNENIAPFSYFEYIVYNSSMYTPSELENIIEHEKVHSDQNHTADILIARIFCLLFWFNPVIWLYKKAIAQNLEFIADKEAAKKLSDKRAYQYTLLKITTHESCIAITNHFYQSLIKKRIVMLNKNQSKKRNLWKYYLVIPALVAFVLLFQVKTIAQEKHQIQKEKADEIKSLDVYKISKTSTDSDLKDIKQKLKTNHNIDFETSEIKRNASSQLTSIKIDIKNGKQQSQSIQTGGNKAIKDFGVIVKTDQNGSKTVGFQTSNETANSQIAPEDKLDVQTSQNSKVIKNVKTNHYTVTSCDASAAGDNTNTSVKANTDLSVNETENIVKVKINANPKPIIVINGKFADPDINIEDINPTKISTITIKKGIEAEAKYGETGNHPVIEVVTKVAIGKYEFEPLQGKIVKSSGTQKTFSLTN